MTNVCLTPGLPSVGFELTLIHSSSLFKSLCFILLKIFFKNLGTICLHVCSFHSIAFYLFYPHYFIFQWFGQIVCNEEIKEL